MVKPNPDSAQVKIPPPFVGLIIILLGIASKYLFGVSFISDTLRWGFGALFIVGGIVLLFNSIVGFKKKKTNIPPWEPTTVIVQDGPYKFSRNPIYLAFLMIVAGEICLLNDAVALLLLIPLFLFLNNYVIPKEERYLLEKFPKEYGDYKKAVRRWV